MSLRVISGSAKGRKLKLVPGDSTRPIMDRVKEALFNILGTGVRGATWLDLFAGTGSVGIEALSRGAEHVVFIDNHWPAIRTIRENLTHTKLADRAEVLHGDALAFLRRTPTEAFEYIYIAPPQYKGVWRETLLALDINPAHVQQDGVVIVQIDPVERESIELQALRQFDERIYGNTLLWFFERPDSEDLSPDNPSESTI